MYTFGDNQMAQLGTDDCFQDEKFVIVVYCGYVF
jgi:hypothetical protein